MIITTPPTTFLQIVCKFEIHLKVIFKNNIDEDDNYQIEFEASKCYSVCYTVKPLIVNIPEMWTPPNVNTISRSHLYIFHYEKIVEMWTSTNVNAFAPRCSHFQGFTVLYKALIWSAKNALYIPDGG